MFFDGEFYRRLTVQSSMSSNYHYEVFLFQSKKKNPIKDINQNFGSNKLNEKKSEL